MRAQKNLPGEGAGIDAADWIEAYGSEAAEWDAGAAVRIVDASRRV